MNPNQFAEWLYRQGHCVIKTNSSYWYDIGPKVFQAIPYYQLITPSNDEIGNFFKQSNGIAVRYSIPINQQEGQLSYHVICERKNYELASLTKKARHDVTRGLQYANYEPISLERLAKEGWGLREETLVRQGRRKAESRNYWEILCMSAEGIPGYEAWGALHKGRLIAALLAWTNDDTVSILYQQSLTQYLKFGINNALTYIFTHEVLRRPSVRCIFYGLHSLDAPPSVDEYKFRMGYKAKPVRQRVVFNPRLSFLVNPLICRMLRGFERIFPENPNLTKAEGMLRFYFEGKKPITKQVWPKILVEQREAILSGLGRVLE